MIIREFYSQRKDGVKLFKTYSDKNVYITKVGTSEKYDIAIDIETAEFEYVETEEVIEYGNNPDKQEDNA